MNLIEQFWGLLKRAAIHNYYFETVESLENAIMKAVNAPNRNINRPLRPHLRTVQSLPKVAYRPGGSRAPWQKPGKSSVQSLSFPLNGHYGVILPAHETGGQRLCGEDAHFVLAKKKRKLCRKVQVIKEAQMEPAMVVHRPSL